MDPTLALIALLSGALPAAVKATKQTVDQLGLSNSKEIVPPGPVFVDLDADPNTMVGNGTKDFFTGNTVDGRPFHGYSVYSYDANGKPSMDVHVEYTYADSDVNTDATNNLELIMADELAGA